MREIYNMGKHFCRISGIVEVLYIKCTFACCFSSMRNYLQAVEEFRSTKPAQEQYLEAHDRLLAETHYQLGLASGYNSQYDEAVAQFSRSIEVIEKENGEYTLAVCTITMMDPSIDRFFFLFFSSFVSITY